MYDNYHGRGRCDGNLCIKCILGDAKTCSCCGLKGCCIDWDRCTACRYCDDSVYTGVMASGTMHGDMRTTALATYSAVLGEKSDDESDA